MRETGQIGSFPWRDYWAVAVRRRWSLMGPLFLLGMLGFFASSFWPLGFRSDALLLVDEQQVSKEFVTPNVAASLEGHLQAMTQQILNRARLQELIGQLGLYSKQRAYLSIDEVVDRMRSDITIEPVKSSDRPGDLMTLQISYLASNPSLAQLVTSRLTSLFVEENLRARAQQSVNTTDFLETQLEEARQAQSLAEQRLTDYKAHYLGELPEQQQSNFQVLNSLETQLNAATVALDRSEQERIYLESMKAQYQSMVGALDSNGHPVPPGVVLQDLRNRLAELQSKYTDRYPEVIRLKNEIARMETSVQKGNAVSTGANKNGIATISRSAGNEPSEIEIESRLQATLAEAENRKKEIAGLQQRIREIQARLNLTPVREQELATVTQDYENTRQRYQSLLDKKTQSELATNLEKQQQGEEFRILDQPSLPRKPTEPNRLDILLGGWALGLIAGLTMTAISEATDLRLRGEEEVSLAARTPVFATVPVLLSPREILRATQYRQLEATMIVLMVLVSLATSLYTLMMA